MTDKRLTAFKSFTITLGQAIVVVPLVSLPVFVVGNIKVDSSYASLTR